MQPLFQSIGFHGTVCHLCPYECMLPPGKTGVCRARRNVAGRIVPLAYAKPCVVGIDPMEKKPLFHFFPASPVLSLGMAGCNMRCKNCQNAAISQVCPEEVSSVILRPEALVRLLKERNIGVVAYTYTEPLVAYEYVLDCAIAVREAGLLNVLVSSGFVNAEPLEMLLPWIDAANIDLKSMKEATYKQNCKGRLGAVLDALRIIARSGAVLEVTNLLIPSLNDSVEEVAALTKFVAEELGRKTPLHFSRFFPQYRLSMLPATPLETLHRALEQAKGSGLKHVYLGNVEDAQVTYCTRCGLALVKREGHAVTENFLQHGACPRCGKPLYGRYK